MAGRSMWASLHLLDRQLIDRDGAFCGNVDDLELTTSDDGDSVFVTAIHAGPGVLSRRLGWIRFGTWIERMHRRLDPRELEELRPIPFERVTEVKSAVTLDVRAAELPTGATARWVRDHIIGRIPGADRAAE